MATYNIKVRNFGFANDKHDSPDRYLEAPDIILAVFDQIGISDIVSTDQEGVYNITIQDFGFANDRHNAPGASLVLRADVEDSIGISDEIGHTEATGYERNISESIGISDATGEECVSYRKRISSEAEFDYYCTLSAQVEVVDGGSSGDGICRLKTGETTGTLTSLMLIPSNRSSDESHGYLRKLGIKFVTQLADDNSIEYKYRTFNGGWSDFSYNFTEDRKFYLKESSDITHIEILFTFSRDSADDDAPELHAFEVEDCDSNLGEDFNNCYYKIYKLDSALPIKKIAFQLSQSPPENTIYAIKAGTNRSSRMMTLLSKRIEETQLDSYGDDFDDYEIDEYKWWEPDKYSVYFDEIPQFITGGFGVYTVAESIDINGGMISCKAGNTDGVWGHPAIISKFGVNGEFEFSIEMENFAPKNTNGYGATAYIAIYTRDAHTGIKTGVMAAIIQDPEDTAGTFKIKVYEWKKGVFSEIHSEAGAADGGFKFKREIAANDNATLTVYKYDPVEDAFIEIVIVSEAPEDFTTSETFIVFGIHLTGDQYEATVKFRNFDIVSADNIRPGNKSASYNNTNHDLEHELPVAIYADYIGIFVNPEGFSSNPITSFNAYEDQSEDLSLAIRETGFNIAKAIDPISRKYDLPHADINVDDQGNRFDSIPESSRYILQVAVLDNNYEIIESIQQAIIDGRTLKGREGDVINIAGESCSRVNTNVKSSLVEAITPFYLFERFLSKSERKELMIPSAFDLDKVGIRSAVNETIGESYMDLWGLNFLFSIDMLKETQPTKVIVWGHCEYLDLYPLGLGCIFSDGQYIYAIMFWKVLVEWIDNWSFVGTQYQYDIHIVKMSFDGKPLASWSITQWHRDIFNSSPGFDRLNTLRQNVQYGLGLFGFKDDDYLFLLTPITHQAFWSDRPQRWQRIVKLRKSDLSYDSYSQYQRASDFHAFEALCELGHKDVFFGTTGIRFMLLFTGGYEEINIRYIEYNELFDNVNAPYIFTSYYGSFPFSIGLKDFFPEYEGFFFEVDTIKDATYDEQSNQYILNIRVRLSDSTFDALVILRPQTRRYVGEIRFFIGMKVVSAKKVESADTSEPPFGVEVFPDKDIYCTRYSLRDIIRLISRSFWLENGNILSRSYYNSHRNLIPKFPEVFLEEEIYANGEILDNTGEFIGTIKITDDYILNLKTGEISLRKLYIESTIITGSYDYMHSLGYIEPSGNRWSVLRDIAVASNYLVRVNEYGEVEMRDNRYYETLRIYTFTPLESQGYDPEITSTYGKVLRMKYVVFGDMPQGDLSSYDSIKVQNITGSITYVKDTHYTLVKYADEVYVKWIATSVPPNEIPEFIVVSYLVQETIYQLDNRTEEIQRRIARDITGVANQITITGDKLFPAQLPAVAISVFNVAYQISAGDGQIVSEIPTNVIYDDKQPLNVDAKFTLSFDEPVILGTTVYHIDYANESQDYRSGFYDFENLCPPDDFAHFAALNLGTAMPNTKYHVLINHPGPREFRLCTEDDRQDIIDAQESEWEMVRDGAAIKGTWYIWIKWMNSKSFSSGHHTLHWHVYYLKRRTFWTDENGMVFESDAGDPNIQSIMKDKAIHVIITPLNAQESPLFDEDAQEWPISWHEVLNVNKVTLAQKGLNIEFTNNSIGFVPKLIKVEVIAYPLSHTERLVGYSQDMDSVNEFGEKPESIELPFGVNQEILSQVSKEILDYRKAAQKQFDIECVMIPQLQESDLVMLRSDNYRLYRVFKLSNRVSTKGHIAKLNLRAVPSSEISYS